MKCQVCGGTGYIAGPMSFRNVIGSVGENGEARPVFDMKCPTCDGTGFVPTTPAEDAR